MGIPACSAIIGPRQAPYPRCREGRGPENGRRQVTGRRETRKALSLKGGAMHAFKNTGNAIATIVEVFGKAQK